MTEPGVEQPRMVWVGPLPAHMRRADEAPVEDAADEVLVERFEDAPPPPRTALVVGLALSVGVAIGALGPMLLRLPQLAHAPQAERLSIPLRAPVPEPPAASPLDAAEPSTLPVRVAEAVTPTVDPAAEPAAEAPAPPAVHRPRKSGVRLARVNATPHEAASATPASSCHLDSSRAEFDVCAHPMLAAADQDLRRAYDRALKAGSSPEMLRADQADWLQAREAAANRSAVDLAVAYQARIARVEGFAAEAPH